MELISKDDVIKALQKWNCRDSDSLTIHPYEVLRDIPIIEERKEGEWTNAGVLTVRCSNCKSQFHEPEAMNFCPNCGAKMRGE